MHFSGKITSARLKKVTHSSIISPHAALTFHASNTTISLWTPGFMSNKPIQSSLLRLTKNFIAPQMWSSQKTTNCLQGLCCSAWWIADPNIWDILCRSVYLYCLPLPLWSRCSGSSGASHLQALVLARVDNRQTPHPLHSYRVLLKRIRHAYCLLCKSSLICSHLSMANTHENGADTERKQAN